MTTENLQVEAFALKHAKSNSALGPARRPSPLNPAPKLGAGRMPTTGDLNINRLTGTLTVIVSKLPNKRGLGPRQSTPS